MTSKDYKIIAKILHEYANHGPIAKLLSEFIIELKKDNPRFDEHKFRDAVYGDMEVLK